MVTNVVVMVKNNSPKLNPKDLEPSPNGPDRARTQENAVLNPVLYVQYYRL